MSVSALENSNPYPSARCFRRMCHWMFAGASLKCRTVELPFNNATDRRGFLGGSGRRTRVPTYTDVIQPCMSGWPSLGPFENLEDAPVDPAAGPSVVGTANIFAFGWGKTTLSPDHCDYPASNLPAARPEQELIKCMPED